MSVAGEKVLRGLNEAVAMAAMLPDGGFGICPMPGGNHIIGPWDTAVTGPPAGVSCRRCHKTWIARGDRLVPTLDAGDKQT